MANQNRSLGKYCKLFPATLIRFYFATASGPKFQVGSSALDALEQRGSPWILEILRYWTVKMVSKVLVKVNKKEEIKASN